MADLTIYAAEAWGVADGSGGGSDGGGGSGGVVLFDAFTDTDGTPLQSHSPTGGSGSWSKHPSYSSGALAVSGGRLQRADLTPAASLYITDSGHTGADVRATWMQGDDDVTLLADVLCGVGLRVDPSADTGYFAVAFNDETAGTGEWRIVKRAAGVETILASGSKTWLISTPVSMDFTASGTGLTLKINGATVLATSDASIAGPGRFAVIFQPLGVPEGSGGWIDSLSVGSPSGGSLPVVPGPEGVSATVSGVEAVGAAESGKVAAAVTGLDPFGWADRGAISASLAAADAWVWSEASGFSLVVVALDAWAALEASPAASTLVFAADAWGFADRAIGSALAPVVFDVRPWAFGSPHPFAGPPYVPTPTIVYACESWGAAESRAAVAAAVSATESIGWAERASIAAGVWTSDAWGAAESAYTRSIVATVSYSIYGSEAGGPIDYSSPIAVTTETHWATPPLAVPGLYRFGVRATSMLSGLEESNADAVVEIALDATGVDVTSRPAPVANLRAYAAAAGVVRVEWTHVMPSGANRPTGFRVYAGTPTPNYSTPLATVPATASLAGTFRANLTGLADGVPVAIAVRAYNAASEDASTSYITATPDATPPAAVGGLTGTAVSGG